MRQQRLEVRGTELVVAAHGGDGLSDARAGHLVPGLVDFFRAAAHHALTAPQVAVDVRSEQLHEQPIKVGGDEPGLRQQALLESVRT